MGPTHRCLLVVPRVDKVVVQLNLHPGVDGQLWVGKGGGEVQVRSQKI